MKKCECENQFVFLYKMCDHLFPIGLKTSGVLIVAGWNRGCQHIVFRSTWLTTCRHTHKHIYVVDTRCQDMQSCMNIRYVCTFLCCVICLDLLAWCVASEPPHVWGIRVEVHTCTVYRHQQKILNTSTHTYNVKTSFPDFPFRATFNMLLWNHSPQVCKLFIKAVAIRGEKSIAPRKENRLLPHLSQKAVC